MGNTLSNIQLDVIKELMNVGVNESTNILSHILKVEIELNIPTVKIIKIEELMAELQLLGSSPLTAVNLAFQNGFSGVSQLVFTQDSANKLINIFSRDFLEIEELDEIKSGALIEIGNIVLNAVLAEFSNFLKNEFEFFVPDFYENYESDFFSKIKKYSDEVVLLGQSIFSINEYQISGDIIIFMKIESFNHLISLIDNYLINM
jgi:chemotaxis protein CheC